MTALVEGRRPATEAGLLRPSGLQWVGWGMVEVRSGAAARDQGRTPAARRPAVGGLGDG